MQNLAMQANLWTVLTTYGAPSVAPSRSLRPSLTRASRNHNNVKLFGEHRAPRFTQIPHAAADPYMIHFVRPQMLLSAKKLQEGHFHAEM